ncbi:MAG: hypothetical protein Q9M94_02295 [Candidatus Gracilibacteria bacterium]|nr:hypothetical protein [Candidatus Gracilibacteria bacterium]MDQ7023810.1 hypothetical protein [Candidatus Gracilibacteria bacterium]
MKNILKALTKNIREDNFSEIDSILEEIHTGGKYSQEQVDGYYELLQEATLYAELKENEYKEGYLGIVEG